MYKFMWGNNSNNELYFAWAYNSYSIAKAILRIKITSQGNYVSLTIMCHEHQSKLKSIL